VGLACSTRGRVEKRVHNIGWKTIARRRLEDNIKMDLREMIRERVDWIQLAQDRDQWRCLVNSVNNQSGFVKAIGFIDWLNKC
jgi:hypothetical protein